MSEIALSPTEVDYVLSTQAVREQSAFLFKRVEAGQGHFIYKPDKLTSTVDYVLKVIQMNYPTLEVPFHSRWGHLRAGSVDRTLDFNEKLAGLDAMEKARTKLDFVITSVLLDAGAGTTWNYKEGSANFGRSEGLALASYYMFLSGIMSDDGKSLRADAEGLGKISQSDLETAFQVTPKNPLVGIPGRLSLINNLKTALGNKKIFKDGRPGNILDYLNGKYGKTIPATAILRAVLDGFGSIWPGRISANGVNLGDVWQHSKLAPAGTLKSLIPFHKLSQWMTYSLIEPIEEAGFTVTDLEELTGLAEYRNGGLMIDAGLIDMRNPSDGRKEWSPDSDLIIEWRAVTVFLLDRIASEVCKRLGKTSQTLPLGKVLEGGTWWAGRWLAQQKREGGGPPLRIKSDGTVF